MNDETTIRAGEIHDIFSFECLATQSEPQTSITSKERGNHDRVKTSRKKAIDFSSMSEVHFRDSTYASVIMGI